MKYPVEFVLKLNEIYHDVEEREYENRHLDMFESEVVRWQKIGRLFIANNFKKICLLDIGSGTGFVPLQIAAFLKKGDLFTCSDISANILDVCKNRILNEKFNCEFDYMKLDGKRINLESNSFGYITMNSVLHHIPDFSTFFKEINRVLKTGGLLIIGHEPNKVFYTHKFLWNNYRFISFVIYPTKFIIAVLRRFNLLDFFKRIFHNFKWEVKTPKRIVEGVNKRLLEEGIIEAPLTDSEITKIVDIHSPTAGGYHRDRGIDTSELLREYLPNFEIEYLETYNHLWRASPIN